MLRPATLKCAITSVGIFAALFLLLSRNRSDIMIGQVDKRTSDATTDDVEKQIQLDSEQTSGPFNMKTCNFDVSAKGQSQIVTAVFKNKTRGTFVEAGAKDGETGSNSLYLEVALGWTGLLVEADPNYFKQLAQMNRRAKIVHACVSPSGKKNSLSIERKNMDNFLSLHGTTFEVQCYPLFNFLEAAGLLKLDVLFLDCDGIERSVLDTFPWHLTDIGMVFAECNPPGPLECEHLTEPLVQIMSKYGYRNISQIENDVVFIKNSMEYSP
ncbi:unnamed protein product [Notodromas monacha]|uniref:Methyltransferase FkbM domain-containing protein n=1 Tax=Notodromas monacha TaxID=399045 RepID=A0A7R9BWE9_9CRUS|nr:unnamed protein product [Notodromas monacha]CAG0923040.1 unnamed protein product [Notodromas monacha]